MSQSKKAISNTDKKEQVILNLINNETDFEKQIVIFQSYRSLLKSPGRIILQLSDLEHNKILCSCSKCQKENGFKEKKKLYLKYYKDEVNALEDKLLNQPYLQRLFILFKIWDFDLSREGNIDLSIDGFTKKIEVQPKSQEEIDIYNNFLYERYSEASTLKAQELIKDFLARYPYMLSKEELIKKEINDIINGGELKSDNIYSRNSYKETFGSLKKGYKLTLGKNKLDYLEIAKIYSANQWYQYASYLENFLEENKSQNKTQVIIGKTPDKKKEKEQVIDKFEDLFYDKKDVQQCINALKSANKPIINMHGDYILGRKDKGAIVAFIDVLLKYKAKIKQFNPNKHVSLLNEFIPGLNISSKAFQNTGTSKYNFYIQHFLDSIT